MPPTRRILTPARIVALVLIAGLVAGLGLLRLGRDDASVTVPAGAQAGQLSLHRCEYRTEQGSRPADCGTLVVPENRRDPSSRLIALPVTRLKARAAHPAEPIFRLEGGPRRGSPCSCAPGRFADRHDVVLVGYRGVDGSSRLDCPEVTSARREAADLLADAALRASAQAFRACASRLRAGGADLAGYTLPQRVDDLEDARRALHYGRVDLLSESAGTRTAMIYAWRHPRSIARSVMIAVNPPGHFLWNPAATDAQLRRFSALCSADAARRVRSGDFLALLRRTDADIPHRWGVLPIHPGNVRLATFFGLMESSKAAAPLSAPVTLDAWRAADHGDPSGLWLQSLAAALIFPGAQVWGDVAAASRADAAVAAAHFASGHRSASGLGDPGNDFLWAGGRLVDGWPATPDDDAYARVRTSEVETLLVGGELDGATPAANATRDLLPDLPNGRQVVLPGFGHTTDFWNAQPAAGSRLVNHFLDTGTVDASRYTPQAVDFSPGVSQVALAKKLAGAMLALALVAALSLVAIARRVRRRGRLGRGTRVAVRSAFALVLGLGGWSGSALIALVLLPGVPVTATGLVVLSTGIPIGLGAYWAWTDRALPAVARRTARVAAVGGAVAGAWVALAAAPLPLGLLAAIVGAVAGTNLALIVRDIAVEAASRRARAATIGAAVEPAREPQPA